jgi:hypothetical protein
MDIASYWIGFLFFPATKGSFLLGNGERTGRKKKPMSLP